MRADDVHQLRAEVRRREHIAYPDHVFVAADDDFIRDMGGSNDDVSPIQLGFVFPTAQLLTE